MSRKARRFAPRPSRPWQLPPLLIRCDACQEQLGRCADELTRSMALRTHAHDCPNRATA